MTFEETLRAKINSYPHMSNERNLLKVVLGAYQQKASSGKVTDEQGLAIVKAMVGTNNEMLYGNATKSPPVEPIFAKDDPRRAPYLEENRLLMSLLPKYLTSEEISAALTAADLVEQVKSAKSEGQATGVAMKHFTSGKIPVEGETVKAVVQKLRA